MSGQQQALIAVFINATKQGRLAAGKTTLSPRKPYTPLRRIRDGKAWVFWVWVFQNPIKPTMGLMGLISSVGIAQR
jgi:hypothetical protein